MRRGKEENEIEVIMWRQLIHFSRSFMYEPNSQIENERDG